MDRDKIFERVRAAKTYTQRATRSAEQEAALEMSAFMSIFHPEVPDDKVRELIQDQRKK